jgi:hemolysin activation/secretion protein
MNFRLCLIAMIMVATICDARAQESNSPAPVAFTNRPDAATAPVAVTNVPAVVVGTLSAPTNGLDTATNANVTTTNVPVAVTNAPAIVVGTPSTPTNGLDTATNADITLTNIPYGVEAEEANSSAVIENLFAAPLPTNAPAKPLPKFEVRAYRIEGNTVLPPERFNVLSNYLGLVDFPRIREGLGQIQLVYRQLGFATVSVTLPRQKLTNGVVLVRVVEGKLAKINVESNHYFSSGNVLRALPSLGTNILLNTKWFQPELDRANLNKDRQIYPVISPGEEPGTSDLTLNVKDQLPLHGHVEIDDKSTPGTPLLRVDSAIQDGNLWQLEHQIGLDYDFSPQQYKYAGDFSDFYEQPMVASYSGFYRIPLAFDQGLREDYENLPVNFGYDEVTHRFNLPPATGNPDVIVYASRSTSDTLLTYGPSTLITSTTDAVISSRFVQRAITENNNLGTKLTVPLRDFLGVKSSLLLGVDYKSYQLQTLSTNLTDFKLYEIDSFGNRVLETNEIISLPANKMQKLYYLPLSVDWVAARPDKWGAFSFNYNQSFFLSSLASARTNFQSVAGSRYAGGNYTTINAGLVRQQNLPANWSAVVNANGQWASAPLIGNEQFALGGTRGVRGYQEGENYGDTGWRVLFDLRAPPVNVGYFPTQGGDVPANLRCSVFTDYGEAYHLHQPSLISIRQWGTGAGFFLTAGEFSARFTLAYALLATPTTPAGGIQAYFSVGYQF